MTKIGDIIKDYLDNNPKIIQKTDIIELLTKINCGKIFNDS